MIGLPADCRFTIAKLFERNRVRRSLSLILLLFFLCAAECVAQQPAKLLIAFSSYRERPKYPTVFFYEHDGAAEGKVVGKIDVSGKRSDSHASLSRDGRLCAFASEEENQTSRVLLWDREEKKLVDLPTINDSPNAQLHPSLSGDGRFIVFAAWGHPNLSQRWDLALYDVLGKRSLPTPSLNTLPFDERMPAISGDGRILAYTSNSKDGAGLTDIHLYGVREASALSAGKLNSPHRDAEPSLSADGNLIAFISDRPGGAGGRDVYLFDRARDELVPLRGLNSVAHEQTPSLSPDGRYIAFVSERISGEGERDIFLYDRQMEKLLPTPGLNAKEEDLDPCVVVIGNEP